MRRYALSRSRWARNGLLTGLFILAVTPRAYQPPPEPTVWFERIETFNAALDQRDWAATYQAPHPGLTTMTVGGLALRLYNALSNKPAKLLFSWAVQPSANNYVRQTGACVLGMSVALAGLIVAITIVLRKLAGWPLAMTTAGLMIFEPFYLAQSRILHVDALVSTLMLLSGLLSLVSLQTKQSCYLLLSGLVAGLALLTKTPGLFLVPFTGLTLLVHLLMELRAGWPDHPEGRARWLGVQTWRSLVWPGCLWMLMMALPFALWPAMWVKPLFVLTDMFARTKYYALNPHIYSRFFAGRLYLGERPGVFFYPATLAFSSTFLTLTLSLTALGHYTLWRNRIRPPLRPLTFWLLIAYTFCFAIQMTISAKQRPSYVLPAHLALNVMAGVGIVGLVAMIRQAATAQCTRLARILIPALLVLVVGLQASVALSYAPYYGAHHNHLLGGNRVAVKVIEIMSQNEGITYVSDYLNRQPNAELSEVGTSSWYIFMSLKLQCFPGKVILGMPDSADYYLFDLEAMQRDFEPELWKTAWETYRSQTPRVVVTFDGVGYLWLYAAQPAGPHQQVVIRRGWEGFIGLAWVWTVGLVAVLNWALNAYDQVY
jgi:4-amino-4-deoxy-L-arabinose transferase-like glycosyltransferase